MMEVHSDLQRLREVAAGWGPEDASLAAALARVHAQSRHLGVNRYLLVEELKAASGSRMPNTDGIARTLHGSWIEKLLLTLATPEVTFVAVFDGPAEAVHATVSAVMSLTRQVGLELHPANHRCFILVGHRFFAKWQSSSRQIQAAAVPAFDHEMLPAYWLRLLDYETTDAPVACASGDLHGGREPDVDFALSLHHELQLLQEEVKRASSVRRRLGSQLSDLLRQTKYIGVNRKVLMDELRAPQQRPNPCWTDESQRELEAAAQGTWLDDFLLTVANPEVTKVFLWGAGAGEREGALAGIDMNSVQVAGTVLRSRVSGDVPGRLRLFVYSSSDCPPASCHEPTARFIQATPLPEVTRWGAWIGLRPYWRRLLEQQPGEVREYGVPAADDGRSEPKEAREAGTPVDGFLQMLREEIWRLRLDIQHEGTERSRLRWGLSELLKATRRPGIDREALLQSLENQRVTPNPYIVAAQRFAEVARGTWVDDFLLAVADPGVNQVFLWGSARDERDALSSAVENISWQIRRFHERHLLGTPIPARARVVVYSTGQRPDPSWEQPGARFIEATRLPEFPLLEAAHGILHYLPILLSTQSSMSESDK